MSNAGAAPIGSWRRRVDWLAGLVAASSILTLSARDWWVADVIANLRVQLLIGMLGAILLFLIIRRWKIMLIVVALTLWQGTALRSAFQGDDIEADQFSRASDSATVAEGEQQLRVFLANVLTRNQHHSQIIAQIRTVDPDVFAILELSSTLEASLQQEFSSTHEYFITESQDDGNFGIGLWSRYPLSPAGVSSERTDPAFDRSGHSVAFVPNSCHGHTSAAPDRCQKLRSPKPASGLTRPENSQAAAS